MWFECMDCVFATNSTKQADQHMQKTGHDVTSEDDK